MRPAFCKKLLLSVFFTATLLVLKPGFTFAQRYHVQTYREHDGVASNSVFNAAQDSLGNMWFATRNGLTRYNGVRWEKIRGQEPGAPRGSGLVSIDEQGVVWWVPKGKPSRVSFFVDGQWQELPRAFSGKRTWEIFDQESWINSRGQSNLLLSTRSGHLIHWNGKAWHSWRCGEPGTVVFSMEKVQSRILIATSAGLQAIDLESPSKIYFPAPEIPEGGVFATAHDAATGVTWVFGHQWLARFVNEKFDQLMTVPELDLSLVEPPTSAAHGPDGSLYFVDFSRIYNFHPDLGLEVLTAASGLANKAANFVLQDREQNVWLTSLRGISKIISRRLACYDHIHGLLDDEVSAICQLESGAVVLGHQNGLTVFGPASREISFGSKPDHISRVIDLAEDEKGQLWIAADRQGLGILNDNDDTVHWFDSRDGLSSPVYSILHHPDQGTFVGTSTGLFHKSGPRFEKVTISGLDNEALNYIRRLVLLANNDIAMASGNNGIFILKNGEFSQIKGDELSGSSSTYAIFEHTDGRLWVGTSGGLFQVKSEKLERTTQPDPEIRRPIYSIIQDNSGRFWFGTDEGLTIWDGNQTTRLTVKEGLLGNETNRDALLLTEDGHIWIGTDGGLSIYRQELDTPRTVSPILSFTGMRVNGESLPVNQPLKITGPLSSLTFLFRAPTFTHENRVQFTAKNLLNSNSDQATVIHWPGILPLTNLSPGQYQFQIQATTSDGRKTNSLTTPVITVIPPWQDRWYARLLLIILSLALVWVIFAYIIGKRYAHRLEKEVHHQTADLRLSEEIARRESERLKGTLASISDGVIVVDGQSRIIIFNQAAEAMFSHSRTPEVGCPLIDILPVEALVDADHSRRYRQFLKKPDGPRLVSEQVPVHYDHNTIRWYEISAVPIAGSPGGMVFAFRDITDRRHLEYEERRTQKLESLGVLAGGIAHDFNNLLTIMMGNLSLMKLTLITTAEEDQQLDKIQHATERARNLTRQLLTFAKGGAPLQQPLDLIPIIRDSATFSLSGSNVECHLDLPENLWWSKVDADQIAQIVGNLVLNASQAMPQGGFLKISARNIGQDDQRQVKIQFCDQGTGISKDDLMRIFDPYFSTKEEGSGLGLAIANSIAEKHGGHLSVESSLGNGSTFSLVLPACNQEATELQRPGPSSSLSSSTQLHILFMDDEPEIRLLMSNMLGSLGHISVGSSNGAEAQNLFTSAQKQNQPFDVVILDLTIPGGLGGLETLSLLRKHDLQVKVIVASGYSDDPVMSNFRMFGFSGILNKPFSLQDLEQALGALIEDAKP